METTEQEDSRGAKTGDCPCPPVSAGLKQFEKAIYNDVVDQTSPRARAGFVKNNVVKPDGIQVAADTGSGPSRQFSFPVLQGFFCWSAYGLQSAV